MNIFKHTPLTNDDTSYIALSLINRGIADTRALAIAEGLEDNDWQKVTSAICNCDDYNFPKLCEIEPMLVSIALKKTQCPALKERINSY